MGTNVPQTPVSVLGSRHRDFLPEPSSQYYVVSDAANAAGSFSCPTAETEPVATETPVNATPNESRDSNSISEQVAIRTVRAWLLTICHDLCLRPIPVIVLPQPFCHTYEVPLAGRAWPDRIEIYYSPDQSERDYLLATAHELRHVWQFTYRISPTEKDCNQYAFDFVRRVLTPKCGVYRGPVSERDYAEAAHRRAMEQEVARRQAMRDREIAAHRARQSEPLLSMTDRDNFRVVLLLAAFAVTGFGLFAGLSFLWGWR